MDRKKILVLLLLAASPLAAETVGEAVSDSSRVVDLDEVVVVAQPKEQMRLRWQPLASSVFGDTEMKQLNVRDLRDLSAYVPSFAMPNYGSRLTSSIYMRGTGSRINCDAPSMPVYYDNVPLVTKSAYNSHFYMLDRVDVLRGPQATLYGVNSEGGLVRIYSKNPMSYQGTDVHLGLGNGFSRRAEVAHYHRPTERLAFSVAGFYNGQDGFFRNQNLNEYNDKTDEAGARMRWVWQMTDRLKADVTADYQFVKQNGFAYGEYDVEEGSIADPSTTFMNKYRRNMLNAGLNLSYEADRLMVTSTTSFQHLFDRMNMDQDYVVGDSMQLQQHQRMNAVTEELAVRTRGEGRWQWATGVFGSHVDMMTDAPVTFRPDMNQMLARMILGFLPPTHRDMFTTWEIPYFYVPETFETPQTNLGAFHESNVKLTDRLTATLGLRFDFSKTKIDYEVNARMDLHYAAQMGPRVIEASNALTDSLMGHGSKTSRQLLPKVGLTYRIDDHGSNVYAQVSKGYRAGGYNIQMFNYIVRNEMMANGSQLNRTDYNIPHDETSYAHVNETLEYEPETSWNYEVGSHLNLLDGRLQADLSTYFMRVSDLQLSKMAGVYGFGRMMVNAGKSNHCGIEAALRGTALDNRLTWAATYSYTHAVFKEYKDTVDNREVDYKSKHVPYVPLHAFSAMADYRFHVAGDAVLRSVTVGLNVAGQGKTYWDEANTVAQKLYATLGGHVRLDMGCVDVDVWGRNLTDTEYCTFGLAYANRYFGQRGLPLQAGIDVRLHF